MTRSTSEVERVSQRRRRARLQALGLCPQCGRNPPRPLRFNCGCRNEYERQWKQRRRAAYLDSLEAT